MEKIKVNFKDDTAVLELAEFLKYYINTNTVIICIGTDRCVGDAIGPLVGTMLTDIKFPLHVYGTVDEPIHALNIERRLREIKDMHPGVTIIGVDACLGDDECIGQIHARSYPIHPGKGVGKVLSDVGDASIAAIVDSASNNELFANRTIRLSLVIAMAKICAKALIKAYELAIPAKKKRGRKPKKQVQSIIQEVAIGGNII